MPPRVFVTTVEYLLLIIRRNFTKCIKSTRKAMEFEHSSTEHPRNRPRNSHSFQYVAISPNFAAHFDIFCWVAPIRECNLLYPLLRISSGRYDLLAQKPCLILQVLPRKTGFQGMQDIFSPLNCGFFTLPGETSTVSLGF